MPDHTYSEWLAAAARQPNRTGQRSSTFLPSPVKDTRVDDAHYAEPIFNIGPAKKVTHSLRVGQGRRAAWAHLKHGSDAQIRTGSNMKVGHCRLPRMRKGFQGVDTRGGSELRFQITSVSPVQNSGKPLNSKVPVVYGLRRTSFLNLAIPQHCITWLECHE